MKVKSKKSLKGKLKPAALNTKFSRSIYSNKEFTEIINYERIRADRNGSIFSVTLFSSNDQSRAISLGLKVIDDIRIALVRTE